MFMVQLHVIFNSELDFFSIWELKKINRYGVFLFLQPLPPTLIQIKQHKNYIKKLQVLHSWQYQRIIALIWVHNLSDSADFFLYSIIYSELPRVLHTWPCWLSDTIHHLSCSPLSKTSNLWFIVLWRLKQTIVANQTILHFICRVLFTLVSLRGRN